MGTLSRKIRSISLPARPHPSTALVEEELGKLRLWESSGDFSSSRSIELGLTGLEKLYLCLNDLLDMGSTRQVLSHNDNLVNELLDASVTILDVCGITRDMVSQVKDSVREIESAIRRRKDDSGIEPGTVEYANLRKKMKKDVRRLVARLRQMDSYIASAPLLVDRDSHLSAVIRAVQEVNSSTIFVFRSVLMFLSSPTTGQAKWSLISRLMLKRALETDQKPEVVNELEDAFSALRSARSKGLNTETMHVLQNRFRELEIGIAGIENGLENMFRRLVRTRATLLNLICQ